MEKVPLTAKGFAKLDSELKKLKSVERPAIIAAIAEAREHGDLSENAEYHAARERQSFVEGRIRELEGMIGRSEVIDPSRLCGADQVRRHRRADRRGHRRGEDLPDRRRAGGLIEQGLLNLKSPLARALIGKEPGDSVEVRTPGGLRSYEIRAVASTDADGGVAGARGVSAGGARPRRPPRRRCRAPGAGRPAPASSGRWWCRLRRRLLARRRRRQGRGTLFLDAMFFLLALALPLMLVWLAAWLAEELERQREIVAALAEVDRAAHRRARRDARGARPPAPASPEAIAAGGAGGGARPRRPDLPGRSTGCSPGRRASRRRCRGSPPRPAGRAGPAAPRPAPAPSPPRGAGADGGRAAEELPLPLPAEAEPARPAWPDLVRALDFPRDADDREGFRALKAALRHPALAQMLQAAEDVLNLLSQEGVYVDELPMEPVDPAAWRRFIAGSAAPEVAAVGGIRDPPRSNGPAA